MSEPINDGGPAFPNVPSDPGYTKWDEGMSLRDWFAGQALTGLMANPKRCYNFDGLAQDALRFADAMLKARGGGK